MKRDLTIGARAGFFMLYTTNQTVCDNHQTYKQSLELWERQL